MSTGKEPKIGAKQHLKGFWASIKYSAKKLVELRSGADVRGTIQNINENKQMYGANAWLLMCSIMIASLGLDLNSPAIIIGAMLISPLMAPILGVGLAIGIDDTATLKISLRHFGIAILIALVTSTLYFYFTPIGTYTDEINARTSPTLLDAFVAFFGGIAGIISGSRKDVSNAIPGVAIATALMPPLCVTGFGLANAIKHGFFVNGFEDLGYVEIIFNSFYLFFLNATLVALATFLIVRLLGFPRKKHQDNREARRAHFIIFLLALLLLIPSVFILRKVIEKVDVNNRVETAIHDSFGEYEKYIDDWTLLRTDSSMTVIVKVYGSVSTDVMQECKEKLSTAIPEANIELIPTTEIDLNKFELSQAHVSRLDSMYKYLKNVQEEYVVEMDDFKEHMKSQREIQATSSELQSTILSMFGKEIDEVYFFNADTLGHPNPSLIIKWDRSIKSSTTRRGVVTRLQDYISSHYNADSLKISYIID